MDSTNRIVIFLFVCLYALEVFEDGNSIYYSYYCLILASYLRQQPHLSASLSPMSVFFLKVKKNHHNLQYFVSLETLEIHGGKHTKVFQVGK